MARGVNKVILVGNLGDDPEVRYAQNGNAITSISVATTAVWKDRDGETQERTEWHRVKFFGKLAEIAGEYLSKGRQVYIEGSIRYSKVEGEGGTKYFTDIVADEMQMLGGGQHRDDDGGDRDRRPSGRHNTGRGAPRGGDRSSGGGYGGRSTGGGKPPAREPEPRQEDPFPDDDIPF